MMGIGVSRFLLCILDTECVRKISLGVLGQGGLLCVSEICVCEGDSLGSAVKEEGGPACYM